MAKNDRLTRDKQKDKELAIQAAKHASEAYAGRQRKFEDLPAYNHIIDVCRILTQHNEMNDRRRAIVELHDIVEDGLCSSEEIRRRYSSEICEQVLLLTKPSAAHFAHCKQVRDHCYWQTLAQSYKASVIKLADCIANTQHLLVEPVDWSRRYIAEKRTFTQYIRFNHPLKDHLHSILRFQHHRLGLAW